MQHVELADLPKLAPSELRLLWVNDGAEGALEAVVERNGERCLMVLHGAVDVERPMSWVLFRLSAEQWLEEDRWHALFEQHVGRHWCFHERTPADPEAGATEAGDPQRFFELYAGRSPRALGDALGWVDEMPAR